MIASPLIACPQAGLVSTSSLRSSVFTPPYGFRPSRHRVQELRQVNLQNLKRKTHVEDMEEINRLLPIDILLRAIYEQAENLERPPTPMPIRLKTSPQIRRLKLRKASKKQRKMALLEQTRNIGKMKKPERGQLIPPVIKPPAVPILELIFSKAGILEAVTRTVAAMLYMQLIDSPNENLESRRSILYREEGSKWIEIFLPGVDDNNPNVSPFFKIFDNTDEGIPEELLCEKNTESALRIYQSRVLIKRFLIREDIEPEEKSLLGQILGVTDEEINFFFLKLQLGRTVGGKSKEELQLLVLENFNDAVKKSEKNGEDFENPNGFYEEFFMPILDELFND